MENIFALNWLISNGKAVKFCDAHGNMAVRCNRASAHGPPRVVETLSMDPERFDEWVRELGLRNASPRIPHRPGSIASPAHSVLEADVKQIGIVAPNPVKRLRSAEASSSHRWQEVKDDVVTPSHKKSRFEAPRTQR